MNFGLDKIWSTLLLNARFKMQLCTPLDTISRVRPRFFDQVRDETMYASSTVACTPSLLLAILDEFK